MIAILVMSAAGLALIALMFRAALIVVRGFPPRREPDWDIEP